VAAKATTCCNLDEMEANWAAITDSVEGATTSAEASTEAGASLTAAATGAGAAEALGALGSLGAFATLTGAEAGAGEAEVGAGAGEAETGVAVAEAEVFVVLAIVLVGYTLYRDVFLSFFTNNIFIRAFQCIK
jgi:hypothetical protein